MILGFLLGYLLGDFFKKWDKDRHFFSALFEFSACDFLTVEQRSSLALANLSEFR